MSDPIGFCLIESTKKFRNNELSIKEFDKLVENSSMKSHEILSAIKPLIPNLFDEVVTVEYIIATNKMDQEELCLVSVKIGLE